jgi:integrase
MFDYAIDREWRERANPCRAVSKHIKPKRAMQPILEAKDAPMFVDRCYMVSELLGDFASVLYGTGLRWQEASALTVGAVDLKRRVIRITQVEREGPTRGIKIASDRGKSDSGFRDVPHPKSLNDPLIVILANRIYGRRPNEWLFTSRTGGRIYYELACSVNSAATWARSMPVAEIACRLYRIQQTISVASTSLSTPMTSSEFCP